MKPPADWNVVDLESPVSARKLAAITPAKQVGRVRFCGKLTERDHQKLAAHLRRHPRILLRAFQLWGEPEDNLEFLKYYPGLKRLEVDIQTLQSIDGLKHVAKSLEELSLCPTKAKFSLEFLAPFRHLKTLFLEGHQKGIEIISSLRNLEELTLRSITLPDMELIADLPKLKSLDLKLGGTKNLGALARLKSLKYLEIWKVRLLDDISVISQITTLQQIYFQALQNVTAIPSLRKLQKLRRVTLSDMKGIHDLSPLLEAKVLEDLIINYGRHLTPQAFRPLQKHPSLKAIGAGLGSHKKNNAVIAMFPKLQHEIQYPFVYR